MNEKSLVNEVCDEFSLTQQELAEKMGVKLATVKSWSSKNEVPLWATNFIQILRENKKQNRIISNFQAISTIFKNTDNLEFLSTKELKIE